MRTLLTLGSGIVNRIHQRPHAIIEQTIRLQKIDDVELVLDIFAGVGYREVEPGRRSMLGEWRHVCLYVCMCTVDSVIVRA